MESVLGRYRNLVILVGVLFLQVLGLAVQVKRGTDAENTRLIRIWAVGAMTPLERVLVSVQNAGAGVWHNYFYLRGVRAENRQLREQIDQMRLEQVRLSQDAEQARRLQSLLAFKEQFIAKTVAAQVIGSSGSDLSRIVYIDKGEEAGIKRDMAVVTADGIVGKVLQVFPSVSQVLLINDQSSGVGAILETSRLQGVLKGTANGEVMLERVMSDEQVVPGEKILSSGGDRIFPKGLPVGTVSKVTPGKELFLNIKVKPAADLSKLEEVLVVTEKQDRSAFADDKVRVRASDILAQRLPSVPDKPPDAASGAAGSTNKAVATTPGAPSQPKANLAAKPPEGSPNRATSASSAPSAGSGVASGASAKSPLAATPKPPDGTAAKGQLSPSSPAKPAGSTATQSQGTSATSPTRTGSTAPSKPAPRIELLPGQPAPTKTATPKSAPPGNAGGTASPASTTKPAQPPQTPTAKPQASPQVPPDSPGQDSPN